MESTATQTDTYGAPPALFAGAMVVGLLLHWNPLYVATAGVYLGVALLVNGLSPVVLVVPAIVVLQWGVIAREERYLAAKFGEPYVAYQKRVRRWL